MPCPLAAGIGILAPRNFYYAEISTGKIETIVNAYKQDVAVLTPQEVESIIALSGFDASILFFQTPLIHARMPSERSESIY